MDIKTILGESYRDDMTLEEINAALADIEMIPKSDVAKNYVLKSVSDKIASDLAAEKKKNRQAADDKTTLEGRIAAIEEDLKAAKKAATIAEHEKSFIASGYSATLAAAAAQALADGDIETFMAKQADFIKEHDAAIAAQKAKDTHPPAGGGDGGVKYTKEQFRAMSLSEKAKLAETDRAAYDALVKM